MGAGSPTQEDTWRAWPGSAWEWAQRGSYYSLWPYREVWAWPIWQRASSLGFLWLFLLLSAPCLCPPGP
jgi:hypothetical protein